MIEFGRYTLHALETGRFRLDGGAMFGIIPRPLWDRRIKPDARNRIELAMRCLLIEGDGRVILVDDGLGDKYDDRFADIYGVDHGNATLDRALEEAGFARESITDVILTHLHFDHCGGSTRREEGEVVPAFPQARFYVQQRHWDWAMHPNVREQGSFLAENLTPLGMSDQLSLVDGEFELFSGIHLHLAHGHTEAQQLVRVTDGARNLVFVADLLPTVHHLAPAWNMAYDVRPLVTIEEKGRFLARATASGWSLFFEHDPQVVVADLEATARGFATHSHRGLSEL